MRDFAHQRYSAIFWGVLTITYSQDATTDIDAKYVERRGSTKGCAFWRSQNHTLTSTPPFSLKPPFWSPILSVLRNFRPKTALTLEVLRVNDP